MKLIKQPNDWSCLITSAAMVLDCEVDELVKELGHDGSEPVFKGPEPYCHKAFHIQEIIRLAHKRNYAVVEYQPNPISGTSYDDTEYPLPKQPVPLDVKGIFYGKAGTYYHAVAWDGYNVYDPNGTTYKLDRFSFVIFWAFYNIRSS